MTIIKDELARLRAVVAKLEMRVVVLERTEATLRNMLTLPAGIAELVLAQGTVTDPDLVAWLRALPEAIASLPAPVGTREREGLLA